MSICPLHPSTRARTSSASLHICFKVPLLCPPCHPTGVCPPLLLMELLILHVEALPAAPPPRPSSHSPPLHSPSLPAWHALASVILFFWEHAFGTSRGAPADKGAADKGAADACGVPADLGSARNLRRRERGEPSKRFGRGRRRAISPEEARKGILRLWWGRQQLWEARFFSESQLAGETG